MSANSGPIILALVEGLLWAIIAWHYGRASGMKYAIRRMPRPALKPNPDRNKPHNFCPTRTMDGRIEILCWLSEGHEGECK